MEKLFDDGRLVVETNGSGEVFVRAAADRRTRLRIGPEGDGLIATAHDGQLVPWAKCGLSAVLVTGR